MSEEKKWYRSRTIWGGIVALAATVGGLFGVEIGTETQDALVTTIADAAVAIGALVAIFGRLEATARIG